MPSARIFLRVCRVSSANREVFHLTPAPVVAERSAYLCFDVAHDVDLFGFRQSRSPHLCVLAAGDGPFYRRSTAAAWSVSPHLPTSP
jgi:hypothetical protein